jgi:hypothetical protein
MMLADPVKVKYRTHFPLDASWRCAACKAGYCEPPKRIIIDFPNISIIMLKKYQPIAKNICFVQNRSRRCISIDGSVNQE